MNVGFIGTGSMGSILIEAFIQSGALNPEEVMASNRSRDKVVRLASRYPGLRVAGSNVETASSNDIIFLCIKPLEYKRVIDEIRPHVDAGQIMVSITSPVLIKHLEDSLPCKIAKVIPSITNYALSGACLCMYSDRMTIEDQKVVESMFQRISAPLHVSEQFTRVSSDLSSCGPAFICYFLQQFVDAAAEETGISKDDATKLVSEMLLGTAKLLTEHDFTPTSLQQRVCVPGGITAEALNLMRIDTDGMFNRLIQTTHAKYNDDLAKIETLFYG